MLAGTGSGSAPAAISARALSGGDLVVAGPGLQWRAADGSLVRPVGATVRAVVTTADGTFAATGEPYLRRYDGGLADVGRNGPRFEDVEITALSADARGDLYVASSYGASLHEIKRFNPAGGGDLPLPVVVGRAVTSVDVSTEPCVVVYSSDRPGVHVLNVCTRAAVGTIPTAATPAAVRTAPGSTVLAAPAVGGPIQRLDAAGNVVKAYAANPGAGAWAAVDVTADGRAFWASTRSGALYEFDLESGARLRGPIDAGGRVTGISVVGAPRFDAPLPSAAEAPEAISLDGVPTLAGEAVQAFAPPPPEGATCTPAAESTVELAFDRVFAETTGPYSGAFTTRLVGVVGPQSVPSTAGVLGLPTGELRRLDGSFSIHAPDGTDVAGTISGASGNGVCAVFPQPQVFPNSCCWGGPEAAARGEDEALHGRALAYTAQIVRGGREYVDRGVVDVFAEQYVLHWSRGDAATKEVKASFGSREVAVNDVFGPAARAAAHVASIPQATPRVAITVRWKSPRDRFDLKTLGLRPTPGRMLQAHGKLRPGKLRITVKRTATSVAVTIARLGPGQLNFSLARQGGSHEATVETTVKALP